MRKKTINPAGRHKPGKPGMNAGMGIVSSDGTAGPRYGAGRKYKGDK